MTKRATAIVLAIAGATGLTFSFSGGFAASLNASSQALTIYRTCTITATPASTTAVADASVQRARRRATSALPRRATSRPTAAATFACTSGSTWAHASRRYLRLRTSAWPRLRLYLSSRPPQCRTLDIFRVGASWTESGITWNNQPFGTASNNPSSSSKTGSFDVGTKGGCENRTSGYVSGAIVTDDVSSFVAGTASNRGWMLRDDSEDPARRARRLSRPRSSAHSPRRRSWWSPT